MPKEQKKKISERIRIIRECGIEISPACEEVTIFEAKLAYSQGKLEGTIEHCAEPKCPECNLAAYNRGRQDLAEEVVDKFEEWFECNHHPAERCNCEEWLDDKKQEVLSLIKKKI